MDMHTPGKKPEWHSVPHDERNVFQDVAGKTYGVLTPGNIATGAGYLITKSGYNDIDRKHTGRAILKVMTGRMFDVFDGMLADKTGTKSPQGEALDAITDKKLLLDGLDIMGRANIAPRATVRPFIALSVANMVSAAEAKNQGIEVHSSRSGKISTALKWLSLVGYISAKALEESDNKNSKNVRRASNVVAAAAVGLGCYAAQGYFKKAFMEEAPSEAEEQLDSQYVESEGKSYSPGDEQPDMTVPRD